MNKLVTGWNCPYFTVVVGPSASASPIALICITEKPQKTKKKYIKTKSVVNQNWLKKRFSSFFDFLVTLRIFNLILQQLA